MSNLELFKRWSERILKKNQARTLLSNLLIETVFGLEGAEEGVLGQALGDNVLSQRAGVVIGVVQFNKLKRCRVVEIFFLLKVKKVGVLLGVSAEFDFGEGTEGGLAVVLVGLNEDMGGLVDVLDLCRSFFELWNEFLQFK